MKIFTKKKYNFFFSSWDFREITLDIYGWYEVNVLKQNLMESGGKKEKIIIIIKIYERIKNS